MQANSTRKPVDYYQPQVNVSQYLNMLEHY